MTIVFMTTSGILQYDMIGYYLFVCMIYVIVIFLVYMGHCYYNSIEIFVVDYDRYQFVTYDICVRAGDLQ